MVTISLQAAVKNNRTSRKTIKKSQHVKLRHFVIQRGVADGLEDDLETLGPGKRLNDSTIHEFSQQLIR